MLALGFAEMLLGPRVGDTVGTGAVRAGGAGIGAGDGGDGGGAGGNQEWGWGHWGRRTMGLWCHRGHQGMGTLGGPGLGALGLTGAGGRCHWGRWDRQCWGTLAGQAARCCALTPPPQPAEELAGRGVAGGQWVPTDGCPAGSRPPCGARAGCPSAPSPASATRFPVGATGSLAGRALGSFASPGCPRAAREGGLSTTGRMHPTQPACPGTGTPRGEAGMDGRTAVGMDGRGCGYQ